MFTTAITKIVFNKNYSLVVYFISPLNNEIIHIQTHSLNHQSTCLLCSKIWHVDVINEWPIEVVSLFTGELVKKYPTFYHFLLALPTHNQRCFTISRCPYQHTINVVLPFLATPTNTQSTLFYPRLALFTTTSTCSYGVSAGKIHLIP